jgi:hypothetical protein
MGKKERKTLLAVFDFLKLNKERKEKRKVL